MVENFEKRYPIKRTSYTQSVGKLLPHRISQIFQELGFKTWINSGQTNGVDLKVYDNQDNLLLVAEILNWCIGSLLSEKRKNCIIENLLCHNCKKVLIYTNFKNENILENLSNNGISLLKIGYQLLPRYFYNFFKAKDKIISRKIDSRKTKEDLRSKIVEYLQSCSGEIVALVFESRRMNKSFILLVIIYYEGKFYERSIPSFANVI